MALPLLSGWCNLADAPIVSTSRGGQGGQTTQRAYWRAAFNDRWKSKDGREHKDTTWINCVAWGRTAQQIEAAKLEKGQRIYIVEGRLKQRERMDDNGNKVLDEEVVVYQFAIAPPRVG